MMKASWGRGGKVAQKRGEGIGLHRELYDGEAEPSSDVVPIPPRSAGSVQLHSRPGHQRRSDELVRAALVIAVDEDGARAEPPQRVARRLARPRKARRMSGEFHGGTKQSRGERVSGKEQNVVTAHGAIGCGSHHRMPVAGVWVPASKREATPLQQWPALRP